MGSKFVTRNSDLDVVIRPIAPSDNLAIENIIREVLVEFNANKPGFAWQDPELSCLASAYMDADSTYWVALSAGQIVGGCGIAPLSPPIAGVCELQKMYLQKAVRGQGIGEQLINSAMAFAQQHYRWCYLETMATMLKAQQLYRAKGFIALPVPLVATEHSGCDHWFLKEL